MNLANVTTIFRIFLAPIFVVILLTEMQNKEIIAGAVFLVAGLTDSLDGYIARKYNQETRLGEILDPLADKLLITAALSVLVHLELVETWVAVVIILREIFITGFRFYLLAREIMLSSSWIAKRKTTFQHVSIIIIILSQGFPYKEIFFKIGTIFLYIAAFITVYSGVDYIIKYSKVVKKE